MKYINTIITACSLFIILGCASKNKLAKDVKKLTANKNTNYYYLNGSVKGDGSNLLAVGKTIPFDWGYRLIGKEGIEINWAKKNISKTYKFARLRISTATDVREPCVLKIVLNKDNTVLGTMDLSYATYLQVYEIEIPQNSINDVLTDGISIKQIKGDQPVGIFVANNVEKISEVFKPHLLLYNKVNPSFEEAKNMLLNKNVFQPFGWMEGVILDGLQAFAGKTPDGIASLEKRFDQYFTKKGFYYTGLYNTPISNTVMNVETTLPFALYARYHPQHPSLEEVIDFCKKHQDNNKVISDDPKSDYPIIKTEECYTVSYPLAVIGNQRNDQQLLNLTVKNLLARTSALADSSGIYQRTDGKGGRVYRNWSRGVAWYLLGYVRSYEQLKKHPDAALLKKEFIRAAKYVMQFQQENGMWYCFMDEPETGLETSGTAGIAAALKYGYQLGLLDVKAKKAADKATIELKNWLTPDGLLTGTAQVNKGGEALQRSGYRVISPYTLGFMGFLLTPSE